MEARTQEAEAAYQFAGQDNEEPSQPTSPAESSSNESAGPSDSGEAPAPRGEGSGNGNGNNQQGNGNQNGESGQQLDPAAQRREQERMRRDQERDRRENERKERDRRENERREQQRKEQERRERERVMELRSLDVDSICNRAWEIYSAEVKEEGVELFPDNDARELCKRSFRLAEIFLLEEARLRKLRSEPYAVGNEPPVAPETPSQPSSEAPAPAAEPTMGE